VKRRLFNITAVLSLLFLLAVISLWIHSYYMTDGLGTKSFAQTSFSARSESGGIVFTKWVGSPESNWSIYSHEPDTWMYLNPDGEFFGFASATMVMAIMPSNTVVFRSRSITIPHWFLAFLCVIVPVIWIRWCTRIRRVMIGKCTHCAYDLTGNETGKCSECGTSIGTEVAQT